MLLQQILKDLSCPNAPDESLRRFLLVTQVNHDLAKLTLICTDQRCLPKELALQFFSGLGHFAALYSFARTLRRQILKIPHVLISQFVNLVIKGG